MKVKTKVTLFRVSGVLFMLTGLICLFLHWIPAIICFAIGIYQITTNEKRVQKTEEKLKSKKEVTVLTTEQINELNRKNIEKVHIDYTQTNQVTRQKGVDYLMIESRTLQALESLFIIETSPNPDTVISRAQFVRELMVEYNDYPRNGRFVSAVQEGVDRYKTMYYDRDVNAVHVSFLMDAKDNMHEFELHYQDCLGDSFGRYLDKQEEQISQLKRQNAIENRLVKIKAVFDLIEADLTRDAIHISKGRIARMKKKYLQNQ